jgi:hypothetical protein
MTDDRLANDDRDILSWLPIHAAARSDDRKPVG